jgi:transketolase
MNTLGARAGRTVAMNANDDISGQPKIDKPFGVALSHLARERSDIIGLTADLGKYTDLEPFAEQYPDRYFQIGMAEQNLIGVAAGLANAGYTPFATTYGVFAARRAYDFIAIDLAYARANVKVIGGLPGLTTGYGATHQGIDDLALMRAIPGMVVIDPADATEIIQAVPAIAAYIGPVYMRLLRGQVNRVLDPSTYSFEIGKGRELRRGSDATLISTGLMTERALQAAGALAREGIEVTLLHLSTLKPIDSEAVLEAALRTRNVLTLENHTIIGGLGSAVADVIVRHGEPCRFAKIGIPDRFVECGSVPYLVSKYGLGVENVVEATRIAVSERTSASRHA